MICHASLRKAASLTRFLQAAGRDCHGRIAALEPAAHILPRWKEPRHEPALPRRSDRDPVLRPHPDGRDAGRAGRGFRHRSGRGCGQGGGRARGRCGRGYRPRLYRLRAARRARPGPGPSGRDQGRSAALGAGDHRQQGLRLGDADGDHGRRSARQRHDRSGGRGRDGEHDQCALPPQEAPLGRAARA